MSNLITERYLLQNMLSNSCIKLAEIYFGHLSGVEVLKVRLGEVTLRFDPVKISRTEIEKGFTEIGFAIIADPNLALVENIKVAAIELIHKANNMNSLIRNSDYISDRVQIAYDKLSKVFSSVTGTTLEKYIILLKIERAKELILKDEFSLSEIAYMLGYSSVQYLSNQFKKITGYTVSQYKNGAPVERIPLEQII